MRNDFIAINDNKLSMRKKWAWHTSLDISPGICQNILLRKYNRQVMFTSAQKM